MTPPEASDSDLQRIHLQAAIALLAQDLAAPRADAGVVRESVAYVARLHLKLGAPDPSLTRLLRRLGFELDLGLPGRAGYARELTRIAAALAAEDVPPPRPR